MVKTNVIKKWYRVWHKSYGNGKFVAVDYGSNKAAYSSTQGPGA